ncbi:RNA polymerase sigma factor [Sphingosinicella microcystinivorans]|uniref:RNA polymerase sigma factor n=1 Tax=Sphingosinicella microcystinivorans TaxID=335406 RepID=UPI0022F39343|nr:sigma-70 family RNA polymerase sigma factor [Sphingosinicella microcystinivorans]WBX85122.1 sigma-70 family RNA polymerase sigma factor [Sphingosinicella microcystinivorans]
MADSRGVRDEDLVVVAVAGDRAAFEALLRRHYDRIHGLAWQLTGTRADADDVAQDVCCILAEKLGSFRGEAKFSTWLCGIVFNACRDLQRRRHSFSGFTDRLAVLVGLAPAPDGRDLHDALWLKSAIARLKPAYRETVVLVAGQQLTHAEAGAILGISESTVAWRMHEVRRILAAEGEAP